MEKKTAIFPGSFDPFTLGHHDIVSRAIPLFDKIIIAIGKNSTKKKVFSEELMEAKIANLYKNEEKIEVKTYNKLTVEFANENDANFILRGIRNGKDLDYESPIAQVNSKLNPNIETIFLITSPEYSMINSTIVREVYKTGTDVNQFLPFPF